jgi:integrase
MTDLQKLVYRYCAERRDKGELGPETITNTRHILSNFAESTDARPANINRRHVDNWLMRADLGASTRRLRLSTLRVFCQWCVLNDHMRRDPTLGVKTPPVPIGAPRALTVAEVRAVVAVTPDRRGKMIVLLEVQEALRCIEVARAQVGDVDLTTRHIHVRGKRGGGQVTGTIPLSEETARAIEAYLAEVGSRAGPLVRSYTRPDQGVKSRTIGTWVSRWMLEAGVKLAPRDGKSAHALRHSTAHHMLDNGATPAEGQQALRHRSQVTFEVYSRGRVEPRLREAMGGRSYT